MSEDKINPELKKHLESLRDVPQRGLQANHASRENYLAQVKTLKPRPLSQAQPNRKTPAAGRRSWASRLAVMAAVLLTALSGLGGTVYAAQAALPDDLLYPVKTLTEDIQVSLESDPQDRLDLYASFASRRLQEIQAQVEAGQEVSQKALDLLEKHTQKMLEQAAQIGESGLEHALRQIEQNLEKQNQQMEKLGQDHPQGGAPGLVKAQEKIRERLELVENGIQEPQGFRETMRERNEKQDNPGQDKKEGNDNSNKPETPPGQEKKNGNSQGKGDGGTGPEITPTTGNGSNN